MKRIWLQFCRSQKTSTGVKSVGGEMLVFILLEISPQVASSVAYIEILPAVLIIVQST